MADLTNDIIQKIYEIYKQKGYISENSVFDLIIDAGLPLDETDRVIDRLLSMGVLIQDEPVPVQSEIDDDEENDVDRTQLDYEEIYSRVLEIDPSLDYIIDYVRQVPAPRTHEISNLMVQAKSGNEYARNRIIELMMKIAIKMALNFTERYHTDLGDTIQYAFEGLIIAYDKFEIGRQDNFTTYAPWWIRQNIDRTIDICAGIHTPVHVDEQIKQVSELIDSHYCDSCTQHDVCPNLIKEICDKVEIKEDRAYTYIMFLTPSVSIEELVENEEEPADEDAFENMMEAINAAELKEIVASVFETLTPKEEKIIKMRFGFEDGVERTLEEVGREFGVTRERVRQIEAKALRKLRHPSRSKRLLGIGQPIRKKVEEKPVVYANGKTARPETYAEKKKSELEGNIKRKETQETITANQEGSIEDVLIHSNSTYLETDTINEVVSSMRNQFIEEPQKNEVDDGGIHDTHAVYDDEAIVETEATVFKKRDVEIDLPPETVTQETELGYKESIAEISNHEISAFDLENDFEDEPKAEIKIYGEIGTSQEDDIIDNQEITIDYIIKLLKSEDGILEIIDEVLSKMLIRDRESIRMRLGMCDYPISSIETVAQRFNISVEKVIKVDKKFLQHIKNYLSDIIPVKEFVDEENDDIEQVNCSAQMEAEDDYEYSEEKAKELEVLANDCDIDAMLELADLYYFNDFDEKALYWYETAAEFESADGMYSAGIMYRDGQGTEQNYEKALEWFLKAAEQDHPGAINEVGVYYHNQKNMRGKHTEAIKWYKRAAELGELHAQCNLGWYYEYGLGCEPDIYLAKKYYELSAEQGFEDAIRYLKRINKKI